MLKSLFEQLQAARLSALLGSGVGLVRAAHLSEVGLVCCKYHNRLPSFRLRDLPARLVVVVLAVTRAPNLAKLNL